MVRSEQRAARLGLVASQVRVEERNMATAGTWCFRNARLDQYAGQHFRALSHVWRSRCPEARHLFVTCAGRQRTVYSTSVCASG
jgi:hypothetical protein